MSADRRRAELFQHFLRKGAIAARLVEATSISRADLVIEIGAGRVALGAIFHEAVAAVLLELENLGHYAVILLAAAIVLFVLGKWWLQLQADDVVVYCDCPNDASAAILVAKLRKRGILRARPLAGGIDAWREHGLPLERSDIRRAS